MEMTPLTLVVLLAFGLLIAICLTAWTALSFDARPGPAEAERALRTKRAVRPGNPESNARSRPEKSEGRASRRVTVTERPRAGSPGVPAQGASWTSVSPAIGRRTDDRRSSSEVKEGTRSDRTQRERPAVAKEQEHDEDAFERFLRARPDDIDMR